MEFSQPPAQQPTLSGAHGFITAAAAAVAAPPSAHYSYAGHQDAQRGYYAAAPPAYTAQPGGAYSANARRLPSVSELLVPQETTQLPQPASAMYGTYYADRPAHQPQPQPQQQYVPSVYAQPAPAPYTAPSPAAKPFAIDVPSRASGASGHRDSESASSVSSQTTLVDSYSPAAHRPGAKQRPTTVVDGSVCEEDVFAAASILMSLRTCKLPC